VRDGSLTTLARRSVAGSATENEANEGNRRREAGEWGISITSAKSYLNIHFALNKDMRNPQANLGAVVRSTGWIGAVFPARRMDRYADGRTVSFRRRQKAGMLSEIVEELFPDRDDLLIADFGCADGAVPVELLNSPTGRSIRQIIGITRLDYNDCLFKPAAEHPRFRRLVGNLEKWPHGLTLPWAQCDLVTATAFFHYLRRPRAAFDLAYRLLKDDGWLIATFPALNLLRLRRHGFVGLVSRNGRIRRVQGLDAWSALAAKAGFEETQRFAVQWTGVRCLSAFEGWLRRRHLPPLLGSNRLVIYRKRRREPPSM